MFELCGLFARELAIVLCNFRHKSTYFFLILLYFVVGGAVAIGPVLLFCLYVVAGSLVVLGWLSCTAYTVLVVLCCL